MTFAAGGNDGGGPALGETLTNLTSIVTALGFPNTSSFARAYHAPNREGLGLKLAFSGSSTTLPRPGRPRTRTMTAIPTSEIAIRTATHRLEYNGTRKVTPVHPNSCKALIGNVA